jgi:hypothetical protein
MDVGPCFQFTKCNAAKLATLIWAALLVISNNRNYLSMLCDLVRKNLFFPVMSLSTARVEGHP